MISLTVFQILESREPERETQMLLADWETEWNKMIRRSQNDDVSLSRESISKLKRRRLMSG